MKVDARTDIPWRWRSESSLGSSLLILFAIFAVEAVAFYLHVARAVAPFYPPNFDQAGYLALGYSLADSIRVDGLSAAFAPLSGPFLANSVLFPLEGALLALALGVPRAGMLTLNLLSFFALQAALFFLFRRLSRSTAVGAIAVALAILLHTLFNDAGGLFDFRADLVALCGYGIWIVLVLKSGVFTLRGWSLAAGLALAWLVLNRLLTSVYLGGILLVLVFTLALGWRFARTAERRAACAARVKNLFLSAGVAAAMSLYPLLANLRLMYEYYFVSMFVNEEKSIRADELDLHSMVDHLVYYPRTILYNHLGVLWVLASILLVVASGVWVKVLSGGNLRRLFGGLRNWRAEFFFLGATFFVPLALMNLSASKSPVIAGALTIPVLAAVMLVLIEVLSSIPAAVEATGTGRGRSQANPLAVAAFVVLVLGGFVYQSLKEPRAALAFLQATNRLYDQIIRYELNADNRTPSLSVDRVADYLYGAAIQIRAYEKFDERMTFRNLLGISIFGSTREEALKMLADSDVIILSQAHGGRQLAYPMNTAIEAYWQDLWDWSVANRVKLTSSEIGGILHTVFVKSPTQNGAVLPSGVTADLRSSIR